MKILAYNYPYTYFVIENFLPVEEYQSIKTSAPQSVNWELSSQQPGQYGMISNHQIIRKMAGKEMRNFLSKLTGVKVERHKNSIPQLRRTIGATDGVDCHTDFKCGFSVGVFLHMTTWIPEMGGELKIWSKYDHAFQLENMIQPKANTLVVMVFSEKSFHSVAPVVKGVERTTLLTEWNFV
ncbi:MAG: 2OG-Fe(II) oxygenase [Bdellovibrio sp.]|nr:2OG-Fe(II) oxygenase [Bdellovibrio sp.]